MKKCVFLCAIVFLLTSIVGGEGIAWDYYLHNREYAVMKEKVNILPNTLRMSITRGEYGSLRADVTPDAKLCEKLIWRLMKNTGAIEIYPSGETCTVFGCEAGEETVEIALNGEKTVQVDITVTEPKEIRLRSFEIEEEKELESPFSEALVLWMVRALVAAAVVILCAAVILLWRKRGGD